MKGLNITGLKGEKFFFFLTMTGSDGRWKRRRRRKRSRRRRRRKKEEGGVGGIHSYSQSPTVQLQSHLLSLWTLLSRVCLFCFFLDCGQRGGPAFQTRCLTGRTGPASFTPPAAPSSGGPYHKHTQGEAKMCKSAEIPTAAAAVWGEALRCSRKKRRKIDARVLGTKHNCHDLFRYISMRSRSIIQRPRLLLI